MKGWNNNYVKPKKTNCFYDIEIVIDNKSRIIRNLQYSERFNFFYDEGTNEQFGRFEILNWKESKPT